MPTHKNNQKGIAVVGVVLAIIGVIALLFVYKNFSPDDNKRTVKNTFTGSNGKTNPYTEKPKSDRITGNAGELYPYGEIDDKKVLYRPFDEFGTVAIFNMPNNVRAYVIVPPAYGSEDTLVITPYESMPTNKEAVELNSDLGYGFELEMQNFDWDEINPLYVVFDLDQGKTVQEIIKNEKLAYACNPTLTSFNPSVCALMNKVPLGDHTTYQYGILTPARDEANVDVMWMNTTIPIGFENLIVAEIKRQGTYIPQKLTKEIVTDLIKSNKLGEQFAIPMMDIYAHALKLNLLGNTNVLDSTYALNNAMGMYELNKKVHLLDPTISFLREYMKKLDENEQNNIKYRLDDLENSKTSAIEDLLNEGSIKLSAVKSSNALTAVGFLRRMENENYKEAEKTRKEAAEELYKNFTYFLGDDYKESMEYFDNQLWPSLHALIYSQPENVPAVMALVQPVYADFWGDLSSELESMYSGTMSDGELRQMVEAAQAALESGEMDKFNEIMDKIKKKIEDDITNDRYSSIDTLIRDWQILQYFGLDSEAFDDLFKNNLRNKVHEKCEPWTVAKVVSKTLKNFADQSGDSEQKGRLCKIMIDQMLYDDDTVQQWYPDF